VKPKRWIVRQGDGYTVAAILARAGMTPQAIEQGCVFLGKRRVTSPDTPVRVGDEVTIGAPNVTTNPWSVIATSEGLIACNKPAGMPTVADHEGASHALVARVARHLGLPVSSMIVTSRLDREVSGVVVFATSKEAGARLAAARQHGAYTRRYVAIAENLHTVETDTAEPWCAPIGRGRDPLHRAVDGPDAKAAMTLWRVVSRAGRFALLAVEPQTGRTHQIRVHASHAGMPLLGDRDYGGSARLTLENGRVLSLPRIALHAARVTLPDFMAEAPVADALRQMWSDVGGAPEAWEQALTAALTR
jgi:23S rRNA-/tRNA-specific pseudouridylate synthase